MQSKLALFNGTSIGPFQGNFTVKKILPTFSTSPSINAKIFLFTTHEKVSKLYH